MNPRGNSLPGRAVRASARPRNVAAVVAVATAAAPFAAASMPDDVCWPMVGGDGLRTGVTAAAGADELAAAWTVSADLQGRVITFVGPSAVVCSVDAVMALGWVMNGPQKQYFLYAIERGSGAIRWAAGVASPAADSWSAPVIDAANGTVIATTGKTVAAFDIATGAARWTRVLGRNIVNASALVTTDLGVSNRLFITQFDGFGEAGLLTCINVDARLGVANPHDPGEVVWTAAIGGSSGNSPAYADGVVYCSSIGQVFAAGRVQAFDARSETEPAPIWTAVVPDHGFYGGVSVAAREDGLFLYAASYAFEGGMDAARLLKLDALTGEVVWATPCNRTASTPVVLGDGRIVVSGGVWGYGTVPSVEIFVDEGASVSRAWHSVLDTWADDGDEWIEEGEFLALGGWSHLPVVAGGGRWLLAGAIAPSASIGSAYAELFRIDLDLLPPLGTPSGPADRSFIVAQAGLIGSSPAVADGNVYSIGSGGLRAFGVRTPAADVSGDGVVDIEDLYWWTQGRGARDVDGSGVIDEADRAALEQRVRRGELEERRR